MLHRDTLLLAALIGSPFLLRHGASGQSVCAAGKVALVQTRTIFASIPRYAEQDSVLTIAINMYKVDVSRLQGVMDSVARAYQEKSALLPAAARQVELKKLDDQNAQIQQRIQELQQQLRQQRERILQPIEIGVQSVIDSIRTELKCAIIFDVSSGAGIASVNRSLDLTQRVIDRITTTGDTALFGPHSRITRRP